MTNDDSPTYPGPCTPGEEFVIPGTADTACGDDVDLAHCVHCGAGLSPNSTFCHVCKVAVSGGDPDDQTGTADQGP